jgi:hypothetical protein
MLRFRVYLWVQGKERLRRWPDTTTTTTTHVVVILLWPAYNVKRGRRKKKTWMRTHTPQVELWFFRGDIIFLFLQQKQRDGRVSRCMGKKRWWKV